MSPLPWHDIDTALTTIAQERANYGAYQNRFESVISNLQVTVENQTAAKGRITDADFATDREPLACADPATSWHGDVDPSQPVAATSVVPAALSVNRAAVW